MTCYLVTGLLRDARFSASIFEVVPEAMERLCGLIDAEVLGIVRERVAKNFRYGPYRSTLKLGEQSRLMSLFDATDEAYEANLLQFLMNGDRPD